MLDGFYHQQVDITIRRGFTVGIRTKEDDLLRLKFLDEDVKVGKQLIGNPVDRITGVPEHVHANPRGLNRGRDHILILTNKGGGASGEEGTEEKLKAED